MKVKIDLTETALFFFNLYDNFASPPSNDPRFRLAGRIPGWRLGIPPSDSKPSSKAKPTPSLSAATSTSASSKLTKGSTRSSGAPPLTPGFITDVGDDVEFSFSNLFEDAVDEETERAESLARVRKKAPSASVVSPSVYNFI